MIGHILRRNRFIKLVEGKIEESIQVKERRRRGLKQPLNYLKRQEDNGNTKRQHLIPLFGELSLEGAVDLSKRGYGMNKFILSFRSYEQG
jgi:hypothetical protein